MPFTYQHLNNHKLHEPEDTEITLRYFMLLLMMMKRNISFMVIFWCIKRVFIIFDVLRYRLQIKSARSIENFRIFNIFAIVWFSMK